MGKFLRQIMGLAKRRARRYLGVAKVLMQSSAYQRYPHSTTKRTIRSAFFIQFNNWFAAVLAKPYFDSLIVY